jgi:hypothetical protein
MISRIKCKLAMHISNRHPMFDVVAVLLCRLTNGVSHAMSDLTVSPGIQIQDTERVLTSKPSINRQSTSVLHQLAHVHSQMQMVHRSSSSRPADVQASEQDMHDVVRVDNSMVAAEGMRHSRIDESTQELHGTDPPDHASQQPKEDDVFLDEHAQPSELTTLVDSAAAIVRATSGRPSLLRSTSHAQLSSMVQTLMRSVPPSEAADDSCGVCLDVGTFVSLKGCSHRLCGK